MPTTAKISTDFSKNYKRLSETTWFVRDYHTLLDFDQDDRWHSR